MKQTMTILMAMAILAPATMLAATPSQPTGLADNDTLIVNNPSKVTVVTGDSLQTIRIEGRQDDPNFRYENTLQLVDSNYVSSLSLNGDNWDFSLPIGKKQGDEKVENEVAMHLGFGWCHALNAPDDMDFSMMSSWEIFWTIAEWNYTPKGSRSTWSAGIGVDWRNYRMTDHQRFLKTEDDHIVLGDYPEGVRPKFSRVKVFSLQFPFMYTYSISDDFAVSVGPVLNFNLHSSLKTRYKQDGSKKKETMNGAQVNPVSVDFMLAVDTPFLPFYVKYSPCNVLKSAYAPKFQSLSVGIYI